ncbi:DUF2059 domain-containing protein [Sphingopyxis sp. KK2]|uniref:DUF2059 domain-containing protein n=1 Tax=Sphingopyxis sp. KK2 TaxID=1855727 RepID=UPI001181B151|nr:DUF2059 domain-containing protein [Sphingopyxis sp. KK2]
MSTFKAMLLAGAMALTPLAAHAAAPKEAPVAEIVAADAANDSMTSEQALAGAKAKMQEEMDKAIAMVEKLFGTKDLPPVDPARLALAQKTTAALIPPGSLEKMLDNLYGKMFETFLEEMGGTSDLSLSIKTGVDSETIAALDADTKKAVADVFDPYRKQRDDQMIKVIRPLISEFLTDLEPSMRDGLAHAYARKLTAAQLTELNTFFATPTGSVYAAESMALGADPQVMVTMLKAMPPVISKFIDKGPTLEKQFKDLPKEKSLTDMTDADLAKLAKLMKVDVKVLKDQRDMWNGMGDDTVAAEAADDWGSDDAAMGAADAAAAAADAAADGDYAGYDRSNWTDADREKVEALEAAASEANAAAYQAEADAAAKARKKLGLPEPDTAE